MIQNSVYGKMSEIQILRSKLNYLALAKAMR